MTRTPVSRSKGQGHQAALLTTVLTRQASAAVGVGTYWPWETATLRSAWQSEALRRPQREERAGHIVATAAYTACCPIIIIIINNVLI